MNDVERLFKDRQLVDLDIITESVQKENVKQLEKWGVQNSSPIEWMLWLTEEIGELAQAIAEYVYRKGDPRQIYKESIQVITLAAKIAESSLRA